MIEAKQIKKSLSKVICHKCGKTLENSRFATITSVDVALVAYVICASCQAQSIVTLTTLGVGSVPLVSDLTGSEVGKFVNKKSVSYSEILDLHKALKKEKYMELIAQKRKILGKGTKSLRAERKVPAVVFARGVESISLTMDTREFAKVFAEAGETTLIDLNIDGKKESVLVKEVQYHPVTDEIIHVGFFKVDLTEKISAEIPVEVVGEEDNALVKSGGALVLTLLNEITVEALPADLPSEFTVDVSNIAEIGEGVTVGQLSYDREKVEITGFEEEEPVVRLDYAEMQEEEEPEVSEEELIEGIEATEEAAEEGEEAKGEGQPAPEEAKEE